MSPRRRLAGTRWRFLAHGQPDPVTKMYGPEIALASTDGPPSVFDELVVDTWLHVEQMQTGLWWVRLGGTNFNVRVDRDGRCVEVSDYDGDQYPTTEA